MNENVETSNVKKRSEFIIKTNAHIERVNDLANRFAKILSAQAKYHDITKFEDPELSIYSEISPKLATVEYMSDEYKKLIEEMGEAIRHHYKNNPHHPEYYSNGIDGMDLFDIIEMLIDWISSTESNGQDAVDTAIDANIKRFNISPQLANILTNTIKMWRVCAKREYNCMKDKE